MVSQKLLEFAKSLVTDFQLKSLKSSEILFKICNLNMIERNLSCYTNLIFHLAPVLSKHGLKMGSWPIHFSAHNFLSVNILSILTAAYFILLYDTQFLTISFKSFHVFIQ